MREVILSNRNSGFTDLIRLSFPKIPSGLRFASHWMRRAARLPLSAVRSRQQVHPVVPGDHCIRPSRTTRVAGVQS
jgi:hypothetical protein